MVFDLAASGAFAPWVDVSELLRRMIVDARVALLCHVSNDLLCLLGDVTDLARLLPAKQKAMPGHIADGIVIGCNKCLTDVIAQPLVELGGEKLCLDLQLLQVCVWLSICNISGLDVATLRGLFSCVSLQGPLLRLLICIWLWHLRLLEVLLVELHHVVRVSANLLSSVAYAECELLI